MASVLYEVCVESAADARTAEQAGAARVELCAGLLEGGTTPSFGAMIAARAGVAIPVVALIRPRAGDFVYSEGELSVIERDVDAAKEAGLDGVAFGFLDRRGELDLARLERLVARSRPLEVTFHRAFDHARDPRAALALLAALGIDRVLSAGGVADALAGAERLRELVDLARGSIRVVGAGGVRPENVARIVRTSGVGEVHGSASRLDGPLAFTGSRSTDPARVQALVRALAAI